MTFRTKAEGGRRELPLLRGLGYRPHIVIGDPAQVTAVIGPDCVIRE